MQNEMLATTTAKLRKKTGQQAKHKKNPNPTTPPIRQSTTS
jgi:hypothetical protein